MRISVVTGRDPALVKSRVDSLSSVGAEVLWHPGTTVHPSDGVRTLRSVLDLLKADGCPHVAIVTFQEWIVQKFGEWVERGDISIEEVSIYVEESGGGGPFAFNQDGTLQAGWPFGYFICEEEPQ